MTLYLTEADVESLLGPEDALEAMEACFFRLARGAVENRPFDEALAASADEGFAAARYLAEAAVSDTAELEPLVEQVLAANESQVAAYRAGKEGLLGFFVGQVMKQTQGKANPKVVSELLREKLSA